MSLTAPAPSLRIPAFTYGDRIRRIRMDQPGDLNQERFGEVLGVNGAYIGRHELMTEPPTRNQRLLANSIELRFGVPAEWILTGEYTHRNDTIPSQSAGDQYTARDSNPEPAD